VFLRLQAARAGSFRDALRAQRPDLDDDLVALRRMAAVYVVVLVGLGLTERYPAPGWLAGVLAIAVVVAPFGITALGLGLVRAAVPLLRERWPQAVRYRYQLRDELARAVAEAGALTLGELEETLGVPRQTLDEQVAWMVASGELPVAVDHAAGRLVSRHAPATPTRCEGCAGALRPEPRGLVCQHCDRVALALRTGDPGAQAASDVGAAPAAPGAPPPRLALRLDAPAARIGEDVHGEVTVGFAGVRRCEGVRVRLVREVDGAGGDDEVAVRGEATLLQHAEVQGEATARFSLRVPADVVSHDGRTLAVRWRVAARLLGDDVVETAPLRVEPARRPPPDLEAHGRRLQAARRVDAAEYGAALVFVGVVIGIPGAAIVAFPAVATGLALWEGERVGVGAYLLAAVSAYIMWRGLRWCVDGLWPWWALRGRLRAPASAPLGAPLRATFDGRLAGCEATWELTHVERSGTTRSRTVRGRTQQSVDWVATRVRHAAGDVGPGGEIRCAIPAGGPSSCFVGLRRLEWELVVQLRRGGLSREVTAAIDVLPYLAADDADDAAAPAAPADATGP
jgi:hypothetical protein